MEIVSGDDFVPRAPQRQGGIDNFGHSFAAPLARDTRRRLERGKIFPEKMGIKASWRRFYKHRARVSGKHTGCTLDGAPDGGKTASLLAGN